MPLRELLIAIFIMMMLVIFPPLVALCGASQALRLHWTKWLVHFVVVAAAAPIAAVYTEAIPGGGEGVTLLFYLFTAVPSLLGYLAFVAVNTIRTIQGKRSVGTSC